MGPGTIRRVIYDAFFRLDGDLLIMFNFDKKSIRDEDMFPLLPDPLWILGGALPKEKPLPKVELGIALEGARRVWLKHRGR